LLEASPDRCIWGADWPHVANWKTMMNVGELLDVLAIWAPDAALRRKVLVENPHRLYGFGQ
jgi:2-pyrone-4,6-dicarboxylate lactonase